MTKNEFIFKVAEKTEMNKKDVAAIYDPSGHC